MTAPDQAQVTRRLLHVVSFITFAAAFSVRAVDPVIPQIAGGLAVDPATAAMLSTAFAAYGLIQPILGPIADSTGKIRVMTVCLIVLVVSSFLSAIVTNFSTLFVLRIIAGAACGGTFPLGLAIIGDRVPVAQRQVAIGRLLATTISGNLLGAAASGVVADVIHWRGVFVLLGFFALAALISCVVGLWNLPRRVRTPLNVRVAAERFRGIFANPRARICYTAVLLEGMFLFGIFPYVALLLRETGETRASVAGLVIAAFAIGGVFYSLTVRFLLTWLRQERIMIAGGVVAGLALVIVGFLPPWPVQCAAFGIAGFGFYMLHGSIQVYVTELAPASRSSAVAFHSFSFFTGQGLGAIVLGFGLKYLGTPASLAISAMMMVLIGLACARLLPLRGQPINV